MTDLDKFLEGQEKIYSSKFGKHLLMERGIVPEVPQPHHLVGGYLISFRHPFRVSRAVEDFSRRIEDESGIPIQVYHSCDLHTTISDMDKREGFLIKEEVLDGLTKCVRDALNSMEKVKKPTINFSRWLYNPGAIVVAGNPNQSFVDISEAIYSVGKERGINIRMPWGAHITACRFTESRSPDELSDFFKLMEKAPEIGNSNPRYIDVGRLRYTSDGFWKEVYETFALG